MSYKDAEWQELSDKPIFQGGFVDNTPNYELAGYYSPYLRNCRFDGYAIIIRPGHTLHATLTAGSYPKGIGSYLRAVSSGDRIIVRHNQSGTEKLVSIEEDGTVTAVTTGANITSDNRMQFQNVNDVIYCMNGVDDFGKLEGTTYTTPSTGIADFSPSYSVVFNGSHWASGWSDNPNTVYKSVGDDYEDFSSAGSDQYTFEEQVTGLGVTEQGLFYFTKNTISVTGLNDLTDTAGTVTYTTRGLKVKEGAVNHASIVSDGSSIFYLTPSNKLMVVGRGKDIDGYDTKPLSHRKYEGIDKTMEGLDNDQSDSFGYYVENKSLIKRFFKSEGSTFNDVCVVYDTNKDKFLIDSNKFFYGGIFFKNNNYTISMIEPKVYKDEFGQDDEDASIAWEYRTKEFYISDPTYKKIIWETRTLLDINELAECVQSIYADGVVIDTKTVNKDNITPILGGIGIEPIGEYAIGEDGISDSDEADSDLNEIYILRTKGNLNYLGKKFQRRWTNDTLAGKVRLKNVSGKFEIKPELATNLTL